MVSVGRSAEKAVNAVILRLLKASKTVHKWVAYGTMQENQKAGLFYCRPTGNY